MQTREQQETRDTSRESFEQVQPELSRQEDMLAKMIKEQGPADWSLKELVRLQLHYGHVSHFDIRTTSRIVYDLKKKGVLFERTRRVCSLSGRAVNPVAMRCFYVEEFETQRRGRAERIAGALKSEAGRCDCDCCKRWRGLFNDALRQVQRIANPS